MKICIVATNGISLINFRGKLIEQMIELGHEVVCISIEPIEKMKSYIENLGASYYQVAGDRVSIGILGGLKMIKSYKEAFKKISPDICFLYMGKPIMFGGYAAHKCKISHINILVNGLEMAFYSSGFKNNFLKMIFKLLYKKVNKNAENVLFQNTDDYNYFIKHNLSNIKQSHIINGSGVDMTHFKKQLLPKEPIVLMVARLIWSKGIREFLSAIEIVKKKSPDVKVLLVGGLDINDEALTQKELNICINNYNIEYLGHADDVRPYLNRCSIFVLPSYHEGTPRCVLEAMATGRPIITTNSPGCKETVIDGYNGFLVPVKDSNILAQKIEMLIQNPSLREEMAENSYLLCKEKYDVNKVNQSIVEIMEL